MITINEFIAQIENESRRNDALTLLPLIAEASGYKGKLRGSIIGFGQYHYKYESGREGDSSVVAFSPRKQNMVIYIMPGFSELDDLLLKLGKYKTGKSCLYINSLKGIDLSVLQQIVSKSVEIMKNRYQCTE